MNCAEALRMLHDTAGGRAERDAADRHVAHCMDCQAAMLAEEVLGRERSIAPPAPPPAAAARAARAAIRAHEHAPRSTHSFVKGLLAGAALAASIVVAIIVAWPGAQTPLPAATPTITMALNETRAVNIAIDADSALSGAEIYVLVTGDVALEGYAGLHELRWTTDLAMGSNQLTIPVVATGADGGQLMVEVEHETKRRRFLVDIKGAG